MIGYEGAGQLATCTQQDIPTVREQEIGLEVRTVVVEGDDNILNRHGSTDNIIFRSRYAANSGVYLLYLPCPSQYSRRLKTCCVSQLCFAAFVRPLEERLDEICSGQYAQCDFIGEQLLYDWLVRSSNNLFYTFTL